MRILKTRLIMATLLPVFLVTATLAPIFWSNIQNRLEFSRIAAEALLEAESDVLLQDMNESLNHSLAIAEFPSVVGYLGDTQTTQSPYQETLVQQNRKQLGDMLNTLLTHFGRYTRLALIDAEGNERFSTQNSRPPAADPIHAEALYFREAMTLKARSLYVTGPHLGPGATGPETTTLVMDITTPVFGREGERLGVLLVTLDWDSMANSLPHAAGTNPQARALLVDALGNSLLPTGSGTMPFGSSLPTQWPDAWQAMASSNRGEAFLGDHMLLFRTHDIRTHHYRSQAEQVLGFPGTHPWRIGISVPKPGLTYLLTESPWTAVLVALVYVLAVAFGIVWVLSNHHQRRLRARAQRLSLEAKDTARELTDLYQNAPCGYHSLNEHGVITRINPTELRWLGYSAEELIDKQLYRELVTPETREAFDTAFRQVLGEGHEGSAECELMCRDGSTFPVAIEATAQRTSDGFQYSWAMVFDMTERQKLEHLLISQAMTDPLTGLGNRPYLENQADMEIARARRSGEPACLIGIDLDRFKNINDRYGHDVGDLVLQVFAQTAQAQLREEDVLCRMGGEEFTVILTGAEQRKDVEIVAQAIVDAVEMPLHVAKQLVQVSASIGGAFYPHDASSPDALLKAADQAMYKAKKSGANQVCFYDTFDKPDEYASRVDDQGS